MNKILSATLLTFASCSTSAFAELCDQPKTQSDIDYCAKYHFDAADGYLNSVYSRLKQNYVKYPAPKGALVAAQRAWVKFRDAECNQDKVAADGGSETPVILLDCKTHLTIERTQQLENRLFCKEGNMACVTLGNAAD